MTGGTFGNVILDGSGNISKNISIIKVRVVNQLDVSNYEETNIRLDSIINTSIKIGVSKDCNVHLKSLDDVKISINDAFLKRLALISSRRIEMSLINTDCKRLSLSQSDLNGLKLLGKISIGEIQTTLFEAIQLNHWYSKRLLFKKNLGLLSITFIFKTSVFSDQQILDK